MSTADPKPLESRDADLGEGAPPRRHRRLVRDRAADMAMSVDALPLLRAVRRHWWMSAFGAVVSASAALFWASQQEALYVSQATVQIIEGRSNLTSGITGAERRSSNSELVMGSQTQILRSRAVLGAVVDSQPLGTTVVLRDIPEEFLSAVSVRPSGRKFGESLRFHENGWQSAEDTTKTHPYGVPATVGGVSLTIGREAATLVAGSVNVLPREQAIERLRSQLQVAVREKTSLIDVHLTAGSPSMAKGALSKLVSAYVAADAESAKQQATKRRIFIEDQLRQTNAQLVVAERAQGSYRGSQQAYSSQERFASKRTELDQLQLKLQELLGEQRLTSNVSARLDGGDASAKSTALRMLPSMPLAVTPAFSALYADFIGREQSRAQLAKGFTTSSPEMQRADTLVAEAQRRLIAAVHAHVEVLDARVATLTQQVTTVQAELQSNPSAQVDETLLSQSADALRLQATTLRTEYQRARISEAAEVGQVEVLDWPSNPVILPVPTTRVVLFSAALGLLLGAVGAATREALDRTLRTRSSIERMLGIPLLGTIPRIAQETNGTLLALLRKSAKPDSVSRQRVALAAATNVRSVSAEAFRQLRTNVSFSAGPGRGKILMVTSPGEAEGKTSVSINLAVSFAQQRLRVMLVDCDLVRPRVASVLGRENTPGLQQIVLDSAYWRAEIRDTDVTGLSLLSAGDSSSKVLDAAGSLRFRALLDDLSQEYDVIVLDSAPVLAVADSIAMSVAADGVVMVARAGVTRFEEADEAMRHLEAVDANVLGAVLNDIDGRLPAYGVKLYYAYGDASGAGKNRE